MKAVMIGLGTILQSEHFFKTLLLTRQTYRRIQVLEHSISMVALGTYVGPPFILDLRDEDTLKSLSRLDRGPEHYRRNPYLSLKLFHWAWKEGLIDVLTSVDVEDSELNPTVWYSAQRKVVAPYVTFDEPKAAGQGFYLTHDWWGISCKEFLYATRMNSDYSSVDLVVPDLLAGKPVDKVLEDHFPVWSPKSYLDYFRAVEEPQYLSRLAEQLQEIESDKQYKKDLITFLPELAADSASFGAYSLVKMVIRIFRRSWLKKEQT